MTSEQKIVQYLAEAHALESALLQTLTAHIAMTPSSEYRGLLERHLEETREQSENLLRRLADLGESRNPLQLAYGVAQTAIGQLIAAGKFPLDLLRGSGGEEKLLKNAKDAAASEALEIATYDALEAPADAACDRRTAELAREHRAQEEAFLADLRRVIPQLSRDVLAAESGGEPSFDVASTGAAQAAKAEASEVRGAAQTTVRKAAEAAPGTGVNGRANGAPAASEEEPGDVEQPSEATHLPVEGYEELTVAQLLPKLRLLTRPQLEAVAAFEREHRARKRVLERIEQLQSKTRTAGPARRR